MKLEILISTMNLDKLSIFDKMNINENALVINQNTQNNDTIFLNNNLRVYNVIDIGLSNSRNYAVNASTAEICLLADDDEIFITGYDEVIINTFNNNAHADIIAFQVKGIENEFKKYMKRITKIGYLNALRVSSVEIAFRKQSITRKNISFDTDFGSGAKYKMGEESIFLYDCLKAGLVVMFVPTDIAYLHIGKSSWFTGFNEEYLKNKGACFSRMHKKYDFLLILQFVIRKHNLFKKNSISPFQMIYYMWKGRNEYISYCKKRE